MHRPSLTVITVVDNQAGTPASFERFADVVQREATDFDFVLVANAVGTEQSLRLKDTFEIVPDCTTVFLGERVHEDLARLVGIDHAVGDYVLLCDISVDDPESLPPLLARAREGFDLIVGDTPGR